MKKILASVVAAFVLLTACDSNSTETDLNKLQDNKIYFFSSEKCGHCHTAEKYIKTQYPDLEYIKVDVMSRQGYNLLMKASRKYNLGNRIGTPLFAIGDKHIMGWSTRNELEFNKAIKPYIKK